jgi:hypothetical protein
VRAFRSMVAIQIPQDSPPNLRSLPGWLPAGGGG